jgi:hypothetical protein
MVTVLHGLNEDTAEGRRNHVEFWHGWVRLCDEDDEQVVCWCGARRFDLSDSVCVVWHFGDYDEGVVDDGE